MEPRRCEQCNFGASSCTGARHLRHSPTGLATKTAWLLMKPLSFALITSSALCFFSPGNLPGATAGDPTPKPTQGTVKADEVLSPTWRDARGEFAPTLEVFYSTDGSRGFLSFENPGRQRWTSRIFPMWKARIGDLDGSGRDELVLGIWSRMKRHDEPSPSRAIWVMGWEGVDLIPLWQGSAMSLPLVDFEIADVDGDGRSELLAIERRGEQCFWTLYRWNGFGFWVDARRDIPCTAKIGPLTHCVSYLSADEQNIGQRKDKSDKDSEETRCALRRDEEWVL